MFKVGDTVKWQCRNTGRSNRRTQSSFLPYKGIITQVTDKIIAAEYKTTVGNTEIWVNTHRQEFRKLRNGNWIPSHEPNDDPKGRLYLKGE